MKNPLTYLFGTMWRYSQGNRPTVVLYLAMSTAANLVLALEPIVIGLFLNMVQVEGVAAASLPRLLLLLGVLPLLEIVFWLLHGPSRLLENRNAFRVRAAYKEYLLEGTMALPLEWHTDHHSGDTIDKIEKGASALFNFSERTFEVVESVIRLLTAFAALLFFDPPAAVFALIISLGTFFILVLFDRKLVPGYKRVNRMENDISARIFDTLSNITTVIILRVESLVVRSIKAFILKPYAQYDTNLKVNEWKWFSAAFLGRLAVISVIAFYLVAHAKTGGVLVGTIYILYGYANQIRDTFFRFAYMYNDVVRYRTSVANAEELSRDFRQSETLEPQRLPLFWSRLQIEDLSFSYHTAEGADLHLDGIDMEIGKGKRIALIGESGGGKTTFLKVVRDLYHPKALTLLLDNEAIPEGFRGIRDSISLIPQDPEIFATTIRENITLGVEYPDEEIAAFTDMAHFAPVVARLPKGLESSIVEKGVNLSGGEKQRLALARGLLASKDKDIVLLDEPTSSVDFHNELAIYENIFRAFPEKTIIASVHRLHLLSLFDKVYFFREGNIIASGSFEELKDSSEPFRALWERYLATRDATGV